MNNRISIFQLVIIVVYNNLYVYVATKYVVQKEKNSLHPKPLEIQVGVVMTHNLMIVGFASYQNQQLNLVKISQWNLVDQAKHINNNEKSIYNL